MDSHPHAPKYSLIIPVLNDAGAVDQCLGHLREQVTAEVEVIVVDGGSLDDTRERVLMKYPEIRLLESAPGRGIQMNFGAAAAKGQILIFLHADCILPSNWKEELTRAFALPNTALSAFKLRFSAREPFYRLLETGVEFRSRVLRLPYGDQAYAVTRTAFTQLEGFREISLMEDVDFLQRARSLGKTRILQSAVFSSTRNWRQDGFFARCRINLATLMYYYRGTPPDELAHHYHGRKNAVLMFCKKPVPGKVKTRLADGIGKAAAATFYSGMVEKTLQSLHRRSRPYRVIVCFDPPGEYEYFLKWLGPRSAYLPQSGGDLGERMAGAVHTAEAIGYSDLVLIGSDCPDLTPGHIQSALNHLQTCDVVLGPSKDGGYYLIAFHSNCPNLFEGIPWSTPDVLTLTLKKAEKFGLKVHQLEPLRDVDTVQDL